MTPGKTVITEPAFSYRDISGNNILCVSVSERVNLNMKTKGHVYAYMLFSSSEV